MTNTAEVIELQQPLSAADALQQLIDAQNQEAAEFDELVEEVEQLRNDNAVSLKLLDQYKKTIEEKAKINEQAAGVIQALQAKLQKLEVQLSSTQIDAKSAKTNAKENKRLKEQNKRLQAKNAELQKAKEQNARYMKEYREEASRLNKIVAQSKITNIYNKNGELVMIMPYVSGVSVSHEKQGKQLTLIYSDGCGLWRQMALDSNGEIGVAKLTFPEGTPQRTQDLAMKFVCQPSDELEKTCENWLRKVNIAQGGKVSEQDLNLSLLE